MSAERIERGAARVMALKMAQPCRLEQRGLRILAALLAASWLGGITPLAAKPQSGTQPVSYQAPKQTPKPKAKPAAKAKPAPSRTQASAARPVKRGPPLPRAPEAAILDTTPIAPEQAADRLVVSKRARTLELQRGGRTIRRYRIALGRNPLGAKLVQGDGRTPEGVYEASLRKSNSSFYRAIGVSYPSNADRLRAAALGIQPGSAIMIHGLPNERNAATMGHPARDWTDGCIAVSNSEMDEIWRLVPVGTPIIIQP